MALNPHHKRQSEITAELKDGQLNEDKWKIMYEYEQEVDDEGLTQREIDDATKVRYPSINRRELELQGAENYIKGKWGSKRRSPIESKTNEVKDHDPVQNPNPVMCWRELVVECESKHISEDGITKSARRALEDCTREGSCQIAMSGCGAEYQIVQINIKKNIGHPTPAACKYQKIHDISTN